MLHERVKYRTSMQNVDVPIPRVRWYLRGDTVDPTRAHFRAHRCIICRCFSSSDSRTNCGIVLVLSGADSAARWGQIVDFPVPQVVEEIVEEIL